MTITANEKAAIETATGAGGAGPSGPRPASRVNVPRRHPCPDGDDTSTASIRAVASRGGRRGL